MSKTKVVHRFIRSANIDSNIWNRVANRFDPFNNTLTTLTDPSNQRTLTLIGTTNSSTTLAQRTRQLLEKVQPDAVYVQASPQWWNYAKHVNVQNQQTFNQVSKCFPDDPYKFQNHLRGILFRARYLSWKYVFETSLRLPHDFNLFQPGLETQYALKYANSKSTQTVYGGTEFDPTTIESLKTQPDLYFHTYFMRALLTTFKITSSWSSQYDDLIDTLHVRGGQAFAQSIDRSRINFIVGLLSKLAPKQKRILVDQRDVRIFKDLYSLKAKNIVAVVNQWHMHGVQTHWRRITGTELPQQHLSPVADMDIDAIQQKLLVNEWLRQYTSQVTKSQPATWQDYQTNYHKENFQYERTRHTHHVTHEDIPAPGESKHHH